MSSIYTAVWKNGSRLRWAARIMDATSSRLLWASTISRISVLPDRKRLALSAAWRIFRSSAGETSRV